MLLLSLAATNSVPLWYTPKRFTAPTPLINSPTRPLTLNPSLRDGRIVWHGQINRKALTNECARMLRTAEAAAKAAGGGSGKAEGKSSKAKPVKAD